MISFLSSKSETPSSFMNKKYYLKKNYSSFSEVYHALEKKGINSTNDFFKWCCDFISYSGKLVGLSYEEMNILIFVIIQPLMIVVFFLLYILEKRKLNHYIRRVS